MHAARRNNETRSPPIFHGGKGVRTDLSGVLSASLMALCGGCGVTDPRFFFSFSRTEPLAVCVNFEVRRGRREKSCRRRRGLIKTTIIIEKNQIVSKPNPMNLGKTHKKSALAASFLVVRPRSGRERDLLCPPPPGSSEKCTSAARPCQAMRVGSASG